MLGFFSVSFPLRRNCFRIRQIQRSLARAADLIAGKEVGNGKNNGKMNDVAGMEDGWMEDGWMMDDG